MFIVDDLLLLPLRGVHWIAREIHAACQEDLAGEAENITAELRDLYLMFEAGRIIEAEFNAKEKELLDRLDKIEERTPVVEAEDSLPEEEVEMDRVESPPKAPVTV